MPVTPEKFLKQFSNKQLRQLIRETAKTANAKLADIRTTGAAELSGAYITKIRPYLHQHGTKKTEKFKQLYPKGTDKQTLITALQNAQYFNSYIGDSEQLQREAEQQAERLNIDIEDTREFWALVNWGYKNLGYRVDSDSLQKIIAERMRAGQTANGIKRAFSYAQNIAENGDEFINNFSKRGRWLITK